MASPTDLLDNPFRRLLQQPRVPLGTWLMAGSTTTAEAMGRAGFDWLLLDMEHVPVGVAELRGLLQAVAGTPAAPVARVAENSAVLFKQVLDLGAQTVMVPHVNTPEEARQAVSHTKYPPEGQRGFAAMHRASGYGTAPDYVKRANGSIFTILQIETPQAVDNLEAIAAVPGVDALFLGPGDLAAHMGHIGQLQHPEVQAVIADVARRCRAIGKPCGIVGPTPEMAAQFIALGYAYVAVASDLGLLMRQAHACVQAMQPHLGKT